MAEMYVTFGVQYVTADEWEHNGHRGDPHDLVDWASGKGYLTVEYHPSFSPMEDDDPRERARQAAWSWLGGQYAFDYDEKPTVEECPLGEIARMVLP